MSTPAQAFAATADAAQRAAGIVAARHRGDLAGANDLLASLDDLQTRAAGCLLLADLAIALLAQTEGRAIDQVASELSLHLASLPAGIGE